jgi:hypothetical protein
MTEAEWLTSVDVPSMISAIRNQVSSRKPRLYACGCCRIIWDSLPCDASREAVEASERLADGTISLEEFEQFAMAAATAHWGGQAPEGDRFTGLGSFASDYAAASLNDSWQLWLVSDYVAQFLEGKQLESEGFGEDGLEGWADACSESGRPMGWTSKDVYKDPRHFLRDIFGNPFRPMTLDPAWQTSNVVSLAQAICDERAFDRMPILADALEDAGCTHRDILEHCRQPGEHVRGCWVVDLLLGKQ